MHFVGDHVLITHRRRSRTGIDERRVTTVHASWRDLVSSVNCE